MTVHRHALADGRTLAWRETGSGPPLVLLHGWSLSGAAFAGLDEQLPGFRLLCPDLPGHGASSPVSAATFAALADDLADWLEAAVPGEELVLGGWSLGGMAALELAARGSLPLRRLLLFATTPRFTAAADWPWGLPVGQVQALRRNLARRFEPTLGDFFSLTFAEGEADAALLRTLRGSAIRPGGLPDAASAAALLDLLAVQDQRPLLAAIDCPTLVVHGACDRIAPAGAGEAMAAALPRAAWHLLAGAGHAPLWTRPAECAALIRDFCA